MDSKCCKQWTNPDCKSANRGVLDITGISSIEYNLNDDGLIRELRSTPTSTIRAKLPAAVGIEAWMWEFLKTTSLRLNFM
eukprot:1938900-Amphidinium_carterae.1